MSILVDINQLDIYYMTEREDEVAVEATKKDIFEKYPQPILFHLVP